MDIIQCHAIATEVEAAIQNSFPDADIIIHQDPVAAGGVVEPVQDG